MTRLLDRAQFAETLDVLVETSPGSGAFVRDDQVRVVEVQSVIGDRLSEARADIRLDDGIEFVDARERLNCDLRLVVVVGDSGGNGRRILLFGVIDTVSLWCGDDRFSRTPDDSVVSTGGV